MNKKKERDNIAQQVIMEEEENEVSIKVKLEGKIGHEPI